MVWAGKIACIMSIRHTIRQLLNSNIIRAIVCVRGWQRVQTLNRIVCVYRTHTVCGELLLYLDSNSGGVKSLLVLIPKRLQRRCWPRKRKRKVLNEKVALIKIHNKSETAPVLVLPQVLRQARLGVQCGPDSIQLSWNVTDMVTVVQWTAFKISKKSKCFFFRTVIKI